MSGPSSYGAFGAAGSAVQRKAATEIIATSSTSRAGVRNLPSVSMMVVGFQLNASAMPKNSTLKMADAPKESRPNSGVTAVSKDTAPVRGKA